MRFRRAALLLAVLAGLHGLLYVPLVSTNEETDSWTYVASANAILDGSYSTPLKAGFYYVHPVGWFDITGTRIARAAWQAPERQVFRPPGYPLYLALFGKNRVVEGEHTASLVGQGVLFAFGAILLIATVRRWWGERVALLAGALYALDPWSKHYVPLVLSETLAGFVALAAVYTLTRAWEHGGARWWAAVGALTASVALVRAVFVLAIPLAVIAAAIRGDGRARVARVAATALAAAALLVPWLAWTDHVVGKPVMAAWGEGFNLLLAAEGEGHGRSAGDVERSRGFAAELERVRERVPATPELLRDPTAHPRYLEYADTELRAAARARYAERLRDDPLSVVWDAAYRAWFLWAAHNDWYQPGGTAAVALLAVDWLLLALALAGAAFALARRGAARAVTCFLAAYTIVLATHHVEARFAIPLRGVYLALVALALVEATRAVRARQRPE